MATRLAIAFALIAAAIIVVVLVAQAWMQIDAEMSSHGITALLAGVGLSLVIGFGLMALVFYSSRHGYDDDVGGRRPGGDTDPPPPAG